MMAGLDEQRTDEPGTRVLVTTVEVADVVG